MIGHVLLLVGGVGALYFGAEWLVRGSARMAGRMGLSSIVVGLTVVSFGTSAPELVVGVVATLRDAGDLVMGNVLGSNLANVGLILGLTAAIRPLSVASRVVTREIPVMLAITVLLYPVVTDLRVGRVDGVVLLALLVGYLVFVFRSAEGAEPDLLGEYKQYVEEEAGDGEEGPEEDRVAPGILRDTGLVMVGALGLVVGGHAIVESATFLALALGVSETVIGLTVVALGTSLPELATSLVAAIRGEADIAVGNVIGSNVFNLAAVLGISSMVRPFRVSAEILTVELPAVIVVSALILPLAWGRHRIGRWGGVVLLISYFMAGVWVFL